MKEQGQAHGRTVSGKPDLAAIRKRYEAASDGPWTTNDAEGQLGIADTGPNMDIWTTDIVQIESKADAEFIAHAREDLPVVVEALKEARVLLKEIVNAKPARLKTTMFAAEKYLGESE